MSLSKSVGLHLGPRPSLNMGEPGPGPAHGRQLNPGAPHPGPRPSSTLPPELHACAWAWAEHAPPHAPPPPPRPELPLNHCLGTHLEKHMSNTNRRTQIEKNTSNTSCRSKLQEQTCTMSTAALFDTKDHRTCTSIYTPPRRTGGNSHAWFEGSHRRARCCGVLLMRRNRT